MWELSSQLITSSFAIIIGNKTEDFEKEFFATDVLRMHVRSEHH